MKKNQVYASFPKRLAAAIIDGIILAFANIPLTIFLGVLFGIDNNSPVFQPASLLPMVLGWGYYVYFIGSRGQTPGKMAMKIKVVKADGTKLDYLSAFLREVIGKFISGVVFVIGYLWMLWDGKKQTWHDKIAGTLVVEA